MEYEPPASIQTTMISNRKADEHHKGSITSTCEVDMFTHTSCSNVWIHHSYINDQCHNSSGHYKRCLKLVTSILLVSPFCLPNLCFHISLRPPEAELLRNGTTTFLPSFLCLNFLQRSLEFVFASNALFCVIKLPVSVPLRIFLRSLSVHCQATFHAKCPQCEL